MKRSLIIMIAACGLLSCSAETDTKEIAKDNGIKGVRFIGMTVSDIDETLAFYQSAVPYNVVRRDRVSPTEMFPATFVQGDYDEIEVALIEARNVFVQLVDFEPDAPSEPFIRPVKGPGYTHMCFISPASDSAFPKFRKAGLTMVTRGGAPVDLGGYGMHYAYGRDPNGTMIETEVADKPRRDGGPWVGHIGSATPDADRMSEFYTQVLGYGPRRRGEYSERPLIDQVVDYDDTVVRSSWFLSRNLEIEFWEYIQPRTQEREGHAMLDTLGYNMVAFEVDDAEAERARLDSVATFSEPQITPFGWKVITGLDPDGNIIALHERVSAPKTESIDDMLWINLATF